MLDLSDISNKTDFIVSHAKKIGADQVEVLGQISSEFEVNVRDKVVENISHNTTKGLGLKIIFGKKTAFSSTTDWDFETLIDLTNHTFEAAKYSTPDEFNALSENQKPYFDHDLDLRDPSIFEVENQKRLDQALELSVLASEINPKIKSIQSASVSYTDGYSFYSNSKGLFLEKKLSVISNSLQVLASENGQNQIAGWYDHARYEVDLESNKIIAETAVKRSVDRLNPRKIKTGKYRVVFDPSTASSFFASIFPAFSGEMVNKGASFLYDDLSRLTASEILTITDEPHVIRGLGSKIWDADGNPTQRNILINNGIITKFLYDEYYARKTGNSSTGNGIRSYKSTSGIGFHCLMVKPGSQTFSDLLKAVGTGILITGTIGFGVDTVSGNYSKGAFGWFIENGELSFPISDFTIADHLKNMLKNIVMVSNDARKNGSVLSPSVLFSDMTIAGE